MTTIEWTDRTWNPVRGCSRVSEGCRHCYAERQASRFAGPGQPWSGFAREGRWTGRVELVRSKLHEPLRWRKPSRVFVNSMSDMFHESMSDEAIDRVFAAMSRVPRHTFQVLTKRPNRMRAYLAHPDRPAHLLRVVDDGIASLEESARIARNWPWPLPNVWLGVSVENQSTADARIPILLETPARVRFVSYEPALRPVDFSEWMREEFLTCAWCGNAQADMGRDVACEECGEHMPESRDQHWIDWLIVGGESGPGARPCDVSWIRSAVEQCRAAGVPVFVKQLGHCSGLDLSHPKGGDPSEWPADLVVREFPCNG